MNRSGIPVPTLDGSLLDLEPIGLIRLKRGLKSFDVAFASCLNACCMTDTIQTKSKTLNSVKVYPTLSSHKGAAKSVPRILTRGTLLAVPLSAYNDCMVYWLVSWSSARKVVSSSSVGVLCFVCCF
ncbi:hypothetical protein L596_004571 [Steinernema carpocapsae]|uniref:Uncharacterized protein n=1 Tax=Steinernema carpocapsae TaxID=34508 RepID=A0A4U8UWD9_STECR|nr:hypothetical protein L596_004571 [Steinernema carpocapsae]